MDKERVDASMNNAVRAEILRTQGDYTGAIRLFDEAIAENPENAWAYAHRGAAKGAVMYLHDKDGGALADFDKAENLRKAKKGESYPWVFSQRGEAYRLYAQYHMWADSDKKGGALTPTTRQGAVIFNRDAGDWLEKSAANFERSLQEQGQNAWVYAHYGATRTYQFAISKYVTKDAPEVSDKFFQSAKDLFNRAIDNNAMYSWAYTFKAFLFTLRGSAEKDEHGLDDHDQAIQALAEGLKVDINHRLTVLEPLSMLYNYKHDYDNSARSGWLRLQQDPFALVAAYFTAVSSNAVQHDPEHPHLDGKTNDAIFKQAREVIRHRQILARTLLAALEYAQTGNEEPVISALMELQNNPDLETYLIINLDSTLEPLRAKPEHKKLFSPRTSA